MCVWRDNLRSLEKISWVKNFGDKGKINIVEYDSLKEEGIKCGISWVCFLRFLWYR